MRRIDSDQHVRPNCLPPATRTDASALLCLALVNFGQLCSPDTQRESDGASASHFGAHLCERNPGIRRQRNAALSSGDMKRYARRPSRIPRVSRAEQPAIKFASAPRCTMTRPCVLHTNRCRGLAQVLRAVARQMVDWRKQKHVGRGERREDRRPRRWPARENRSHVNGDIATYVEHARVRAVCR